jgi:hypothetical protein
MGYTTDFSGSIAIEPPLNQQEIDYLNKFSGTRRMSCEQGPYYVGRGGFAGQDHGPDVRDYNRPPVGQPGLWCQWVPTADGSAIEWNGGEKFYDSEEWMAYLIGHFLKPGAAASAELSFLQANHTLNGTIKAQGEDMDDRWKLVVKDNVVSRIDLE